MADPIHQFEIQNIAPNLFEIGGLPIHFTNSSLFMVIVVGAIIAFLLLGSAAGRLIPGRLQSLAEMGYEFVADTVRASAGKDGMRFFPLVFALFLFVLFGNMIGLMPGAFTITSHISITFVMAMIVILTVVIYGFMRNGLHFLRLFVPSGVPPLLMLLIVPIEIMSFLSRPITLGLRLFANMLGGHIALKVFAGFVVSLLAAGGVLSALSIAPFLAIVGLTALEILVAFLQAYVFAVLTSIYLNDAIHPGH